MPNRTARDFSRQMIEKIATSYATTPEEYSAEYFSREYDISKDTFYAILKKAVIESIVSDEIVKKMSIKAQKNSRLKVGDCGVARSERYYTYLKNKREEYTFTKKETIEWVHKFLESDCGREKFCDEHKIQLKLMFRTIQKAIEEGLITDEEVEQLKSRALKRFPDEKSKKIWDKMLENRKKRSENKNRK